MGVSAETARHAIPVDPVNALRLQPCRDSCSGKLLLSVPAGTHQAQSPLHTVDECVPKFLGHPWSDTGSHVLLGNK